VTTRRRDGPDVTAFAEWVRANPRLDSYRDCVTNHDIDWIWHQYKIADDSYGKRTINHVMFIEEKSRGKDLDKSHREIMFLLDQILRKKQTFRLWNHDHQLIQVRFWGYFKLRYTGATLPESDTILWNKYPIELDTLTEILRFERNPRTLEKRSDRRHHKPPDRPLLGLMELEN
jgi:hypothetical protein